MSTVDNKKAPFGAFCFDMYCYYLSISIQPRDEL